MGSPEEKKRAPEDTFEIRDPAADVQAIMKQIRQNIERRREEGLYSEEILAEVERLKMHDNAEAKDYFEYSLEAANTLWNIKFDDYKLGIPPRLHKPILAHAVLYTERAIRRLLRFRAVISQQIEFNSHIVQLLNQMHERLVACERRLAQLETKERGDAGEER